VSGTMKLRNAGLTVTVETKFETEFSGDAAALLIMEADVSEDSDALAKFYGKVFKAIAIHYATTSGVGDWHQDAHHNFRQVVEAVLSEYAAAGGLDEPFEYPED
jgi:hypothetical protein